MQTLGEVLLRRMLWHSTGDACIPLWTMTPIFVQRPKQYPKEPFRVLFWSILWYKLGEKGAPRDPIYYT